MPPGALCRSLVALLAGLLSAAPALAGSGALDSIRVAKTITIAYAPNAYPISFKDADGAPRGYAIDLCRRIADGVQQDLGLDALEIAWIEGNTPRRLAAVANGVADIECGPTTMNLARQQYVDFSNVVFVESGGILVRSDAAIGDLADLTGKTIGVVPQTTTERRLRPVLSRRGVDAELVPIRDARDGRERLVAGELDGVAGDRLVLTGQIADSRNAAPLKILEADFSIEPYAFAVPRNDADFRLSVNRALADLYRSGDVDRIFARWLGEDAQPSELLETIFFIYGFAD